MERRVQSPMHRVRVHNRKIARKTASPLLSLSINTPFNTLPLPFQLSSSPFIKQSHPSGFSHFLHPKSNSSLTMGGFSFFLRNFATLLSFLNTLLEKFPSKSLPAQLEKFVASLARTGRHLQRYDHRGYRQVVGCIPYRYKKSDSPSKEIEVLVISAMKGDGMLFPKGGWESDEPMEDAGMRETFEEAGVTGKIECKLGKWFYMSKRGGIMHEGYMFPLLVEQELDIWPEKNTRRRQWVSVNEAREVCKLTWMREALEAFAQRQIDAKQQ